MAENKFVHAYRDGVEVPHAATFQSVTNEKGETLEDTTNRIQSQINAIVAGNTKLTVSVSPSLFFEGVDTQVTVTAKLVGEKGKITLLGQKSAESVSEFSVKETITTTKSYTATAVIKGNTIKSNTATANAYHPIYSGAGTNLDTVAVEANKHKDVKSNPYGEYSFNNVKEGDFLYIIVPSPMTIDPSKVTFKKGGLQLPFKNAVQKQIGGVTYNSYESQTKRKAGDYVIIVNR